MLSRSMTRAGLALLAATAMSACATLPRNGPTGAQIMDDEGDANDIGFEIVDVKADNIDALSTLTLASGALSALAADGMVDTLGPGDVLSIEVYEVGVTLFGGRASIGGAGGAGGAPVGADAPAATGETIGAGGVVVDRDGNITMPYVGTLNVLGQTTAQVQDRILRELRGKSQSPQVIVTLRRNVANTVVVMGAVAEPRRVPLTLARERLLDVIADAGGIARIGTTGASTATGTGAQDAIVRFTRAGRTAEQPLDTILSGSPDDLVLLGGDRIELIRQPRTFTVFGAIDRISQIPFESRTLTLAEALARAGGPNDNRADPRSVFVFRLESQTSAAPEAAAVPVDMPATPSAGAVAAGTMTPAGSMAPAGGVASPVTVLTPVIYRIDMLRAQNYFLAQRFVMRDKDLVYIANASGNQPLKFVQALSQLFAPAITVQNATR